MRFRMLVLSFLLALSTAAGVAPRPAYAAAVPHTAVLLADLPKVDVDVDVHKKHNDWYRNPVIVGLGAAVVVLLIVIAARR
jgi:hypothetical protein